jgi:hypothetical protein
MSQAFVFCALVVVVEAVVQMQLVVVHHPLEVL